MARNKRPEHKAKHKPKRQPKPKKKPGGDTPPPTTSDLNEKLKGQSTQDGQAAMDATPTMQPADAPNDQAIYSTGPGTVVAYNYQRQGTYAEEYALQQAQQDAANPALAGPGQLVSSGAAGNPT